MAPGEVIEKAGFIIRTSEVVHQHFLHVITPDSIINGLIGTKFYMVLIYLKGNSLILKMAVTLVYVENIQRTSSPEQLD